MHEDRRRPVPGPSRRELPAGAHSRDTRWDDGRAYGREAEREAPLHHGLHTHAGPSPVLRQDLPPNTASHLSENGNGVHRVHQLGPVSEFQRLDVRESRWDRSYDRPTAPAAPPSHYSGDEAPLSPSLHNTSRRTEQREMAYPADSSTHRASRDIPQQTHYPRGSSPRHLSPPRLQQREELSGVPRRRAVTLAADQLESTVGIQPSVLTGEPSDGSDRLPRQRENLSNGAPQIMVQDTPQGAERRTSVRLNRRELPHLEPASSQMHERFNGSTSFTGVDRTTAAVPTPSPANHNNVPPMSFNGSSLLARLSSGPPAAELSWSDSRGGSLRQRLEVDDTDSRRGMQLDDEADRRRRKSRRGRGGGSGR